MTTDSWTQTPLTRRIQTDMFQVLKSMLPIKIIIPRKSNLKFKGQIKTFLGMNELKQFMFTKPALQHSKPYYTQKRKNVLHNHKGLGKKQIKLKEQINK